MTVTYNRLEEAFRPVNQKQCLRHQWSDGWICDKCGLKYADYIEQRKAKKVTGTSSSQQRRVSKDIKLTTELIIRNDIHDAPAKTERYGKWHECIIPIGKDHVAYLTLTDDAFQAMCKIWEERYNDK